MKKLSLIVISLTALLAIVLGLAIGSGVMSRSILASSSANKNIGGSLKFINDECDDKDDIVLTATDPFIIHRHSLRQHQVVETTATADPDPSSVSSFVTTTIQPSTAMTMASPTDLYDIVLTATDPFIIHRHSLRQHQVVETTATADPDPSFVTTTIQPSTAMTMASPTDLSYVATFVSSQEQVAVAALSSSSPMTASSSVPASSPAPTFFVKEPVPSSSPTMSSLSSRPSAISLTGSTSSSPTKSTTQSSTFSSPMTSSSMPSSTTDLKYSPTYYVSSTEAVSSSSPTSSGTKVPPAPPTIASSSSAGEGETVPPFPSAEVVSSSSSPNPSSSSSSQASSAVVPSSSISTSARTFSNTLIYTCDGTSSPTATASATPASARTGDGIHKKCFFGNPASGSTRVVDLIMLFTIMVNIIVFLLSSPKKPSRRRYRLAYHLARRCHQRHFASTNTWIKFMSTPPDKTMQMFVRFNKTIVVTVGEKDVAYQLKRLLAFKYGLAIRNVRLVYGTKDLDDHCTFGALLNQSTIHMCVRLLGGNDKKRKAETKKLQRFNLRQTIMTKDKTRSWKPRPLTDLGFTATHATDAVNIPLLPAPLLEAEPDDDEDVIVIDDSDDDDTMTLLDEAKVNHLPAPLLGDAKVIDLCVEDTAEDEDEDDGIVHWKVKGITRKRIQEDSDDDDDEDDTVIDDVCDEDDEVETRFCKNCKKTKSVDKFHLKKSRGKYYRMHTCFKCVQAYMQAQRKRRIAVNAANPVTISEKKCSLCKTIRPVIFFRKKNERKDGYTSHCLLCGFLPTLISNAKINTRRRLQVGRKMPPVEITAADLKNIPPVCAISGVTLVFCTGQVHMASLDRINDNGGYTKKNIRLVDIRLNIRVKWTAEKFYAAFGPDWEQFVEQRRDSLPPPTTKVDGYTLARKLQRIASTCNRKNRMKAAKEGKTCDFERITPDFLMNMWEQQSGNCAYSEIPMGWGHIDRHDWTVSVERLCNGYYVDGNMALVCAECNSSEYQTNRFADTYQEEPQGWSQQVVKNYRARYV